MLTVGLTGGYASGKSFIATELERLGCHLIYADRLGHDVLLPDGEAYSPVIETFGTGILSNGAIDRKKLGEIVFSSPELLQKLTSFVHPAVFRLEQRLLDEYRAQDPSGITVLEAAILIETGHFKGFDRLIVAVCDEETQIARGISRDHLTREQVLERISRQLPTEEKKKYADYIIDTSRKKEETVRQVEQVFRELRKLADSQQP
jgi:dephospho-CoA kinase